MLAIVQTQTSETAEPFAGGRRGGGGDSGRRRDERADQRRCYMSSGIGRPRMQRGRLFTLVAVAAVWHGYLPRAQAGPYIPSSDSAVLAELPAGTRYADVSARRLARGRVDVAIPLAQFYIQQSRLSGDLRYLGYAEAVLAPWVKQNPPRA